MNSRDTRSKFATRFRSLRGKDETQADFAKRINLTRPTVAMYESGKRTPDIETLARICTVCSCSADWLIGLAPVIMRTPVFETQKTVMLDKTARDTLTVLNGLTADIAGIRDKLEQITSMYIKED